jgi:hypothetical protein
MFRLIPRLACSRKSSHKGRSSSVSRGIRRIAVGVGNAVASRWRILPRKCRDAGMTKPTWLRQPTSVLILSPLDDLLEIIFTMSADHSVYLSCGRDRSRRPVSRIHPSMVLTSSRRPSARSLLREAGCPRRTGSCTCGGRLTSSRAKAAACRG